MEGSRVITTTFDTASSSPPSLAVALTTYMCTWWMASSVTSVRVVLVPASNVSSKKPPSVYFSTMYPCTPSAHPSYAFQFNCTDPSSSCSPVSSMGQAVIDGALVLSHTSVYVT